MGPALYNKYRLGCLKFPSRESLGNLPTTYLSTADSKYSTKLLCDRTCRDLANISNFGRRYLDGFWIAKWFCSP
jgi:hypothetical protein